jgi:hypothetical protein
VKAMGRSIACWLYADLQSGEKMNITIPTIAVMAAALILAPVAHADPGIFTPNEAKYLESLAQLGVLPTTLGLHNGRDEVGLGQGICLALDDHSINDVNAGVTRNWPNLTQLQHNALVGFSVSYFCEYNAGKLS